MKRLLALALLLTGCATTGQYERNVQTWLNHPSDELVRAWGIPSRSMILPNGNTLYVYNRADSYAMGAIQMPGTSTVTNNPYAPGGAQYVTSQPGPLLAGQTYALYCSTFFEIQDDRVIFVRYQGNNCVAR